MEDDEHNLLLDNDIKFYRTSPELCPYLEGKYETKILTPLTEKNGQYHYNSLIQLGFRRSQTIAYKPMCYNCNACQSIRVIVNDFQLNKTQKRLLSTHKNTKYVISSPRLSDSHYRLYQKYIHNRHEGEEMSKMSFDDVARMLEQTTVDTVIVEYYNQDNALICWVITDIVHSGLSMVYSVYDPTTAKLSLGTYAILSHIQLAKEMSLPYLYLGYWVKGCQKMSYKINFKPYELQIMNQWIKS
jgi:arginine-tRNA-protein transferase